MFFLFFRYTHIMSHLPPHLVDEEVENARLEAIELKKAPKFSLQ